MCLSKLKPEERRIRNVVSQKYLINTFKVDFLYILAPKVENSGSFIEQEIDPAKIRFLDVIDINQKGFTLVLELQSKQRVLILFSNPMDLDEVVKLVNKAKVNMEEMSKSRLLELRFNIDYFEQLLQNEVPHKFTSKVRNTSYL